MIRVERCINGTGWIAFEAAGDWYCIHETWDEAILCAFARAEQVRA